MKKQREDRPVKHVPTTDRNVLVVYACFSEKLRNQP